MTKPRETIAQRMDREMLIYLSDGSTVRQSELIDELDFYKFAFDSLDKRTKEYLRKKYAKLQEEQ